MFSGRHQNKKQKQEKYKNRDKGNKYQDVVKKRKKRKKR